MREASNAAMDYWFNSLNKSMLRAPKAAINSRSRRLSDSSGMRLIRTEKKEYAAVYWIPNFGKLPVTNGMLVRLADKVVERPLLAKYCIQ